ASPCAGVAGALPRRPKPRDRALDHHAELRPLLKAADTDRPTDRVVRVLAYTGQRRSQAGGMRWSEVDPEAGVWPLPTARSKNHREHRVPLSMQVWRIIDASPRIANCDYVFSYGRNRPVNDWDRAKKRLCAKAGLGEDWRIHDLRRTTAGGL